MYIKIRNENWNSEDRKMVGGIEKWASRGNKKCLEKLRVLEEIALESDYDEFLFRQWMRG